MTKEGAAARKKNADAQGKQPNQSCFECWDTTHYKNACPLLPKDKRGKGGKAKGKGSKGKGKKGVNGVDDSWEHEGEEG